MGPRTAARKLTPHPLYRLYRKRKIARERSRYSPRIVEHTYAGFPLRIRLPDPRPRAGTTATGRSRTRSASCVNAPCSNRERSSSTSAPTRGSWR